MLAEKLQELESGDVLIVSGNIPSAIPQETYSRLLETVKDKDISDESRDERGGAHGCAEIPSVPDKA